MEFYELIQKRESIRNYDPEKPVQIDVLTRVLETGRIAPSAANKQPWKFILVSSETVLGKIKQCYEKEWFHNAPHILAVVGDMNEAWMRKSDGRCFIETDLAISLTYIVLAAANEGLATCWISNFKSDVLRSALGLKENEYVFGITPLGYPMSGFQRKGVKDRKPFKSVVEWR